MYIYSQLHKSSKLSSYLKSGLLCAGIALTATASVFTVPAKANLQDLFNEFDLPVLDPATNTNGPNGLEIDFQGDVCPNIPAQYVRDPGINPFRALELYETSIGGPVVTSSFSCTFDGSITHAQWSGGTIPVPLPATGWPVPLHTDGNGNRYLHSGLDRGASSLTGIVPIYRSWIWTQTNPPQSLIIGSPAALAAKLAEQKRALYAALFIATGGDGQPGGNTPTGTWSLLSYQGSPQFTLSNNSPDTITFPTDGSGIVTGIVGPTEEQCEETPDCYETLLDQLNDQGYPEPGMKVSPFTPINLPSQLAPGQTYTIKARR